MNEKLNIQDLIEMLAERHGMEKQDAEGFVKEFFQLIEESLETDKYVKIRGLGTFKLIDVDSRESVNISTGERFQIQGHTKVSFTPEPALKDVINRPFSHFETVVLNEETVLDDTPMEGSAEEEEKEDEAPAVLVVETTTEMPVEEVAEDRIEIKEETAEVIEEPADNSEEEPTDALVDEPADIVSDEPTEVTEEYVESEIIAEPPAPSPADKADSSTMKFFIGIVGFVVLLCVGAVVFMYYPDMFKSTPSAPTIGNVVDEKAENPELPVALTDSIIEQDTDLIAKEDTVAEVIVSTPVVTAPQKVTKAQEAKKKENQKPAATPFNPDSVTYKIVGTKATYTIKEGETLTRVALHFYGTKTLWPYIVKHNPDVIKNPDHVPYGTVVKIPELVKK